MSLDQIITVNISRTGSNISRENYGTPAIAAYFPVSIFPERSRAYSSLSSVADDFEPGDPVYLQAAAMFAQNPSPTSVKVLRRTKAPQQVLEITPSTPVEGQTFTVTVTGYADSAFSSRAQVTDTVTVTAGPSDTTAANIVTLLKTAFGLLNGATGQAGDWNWTAATDTFVIEAQNTTMEGLIFGVTYAEDGAPKGVDDNTTEDQDAANIGTGLTSDLGAIYDYDPDWYGLCLDSNSAAEITAAAAWVQANDRILVAQTQDVDVSGVAVATDTTSIAATLKSNSYTNVMLFCHRDNLNMVSGAMLGRALPEDPGSITWAFKQLAGVSTQQFTDAELAILQASVGSPTGGKDVNTVTSLASKSVTRYGSSIEGEFMDVIRFSHWLASRLSEDTYVALLDNPKVPLSDAGISMLKGVWLSRLEQGVERGALLADPAPTVDVPLAADISSADRAARLLDNCTFRAMLADAAHFVRIDGQLTR